MKLDVVRRHALSLPDVTEEPHHEYSSFRVHGKIFVTVPPQEDAIHVFVEEEDRERTVALYPDWAQKLLWGGRVRGDLPGFFETIFSRRRPVGVVDCAA